MERYKIEFVIGKKTTADLKIGPYAESEIPVMNDHIEVRLTLIFLESTLTPKLSL